MSKERLYLSGNENLPTQNWTCQFTPEMYAELYKCAKDIIYFAENYFFIINVDEGRQKIKLFDCQKRVLRGWVDNRFSACVASRQVGKTTMLTIFSLWMTLFAKDQNVFILANKEETAKMILSRVALAYEEMPNWIKSPIKELTKTNLVFINGSAVRTSSTSAQGIRGQSVSCVDGSSMVTIRDKNNGNIFDISMKELSDILEKDGEILSYNITDE